MAATLSGHNIIASFHKCDIYPFNRNAIEILDDDTANESGIDWIVAMVMVHQCLKIYILLM